MGAAHRESSLPRVVKLQTDVGSLLPITGALVNRQQGQQGLRCECGVHQRAQGCFSAVQDTGFHIVQGQVVLGAFAVGAAQVGAGQQVLVHPHRAFKLATAAEQIAQREVQFGSVWIPLNRFNEGVNRLVLLLIQQVVQTFEIGFGVAAVFQSKLSQVKPRGQPTQPKGYRQTNENPANLQVHQALILMVCRANQVQPGRLLGPVLAAQLAGPSDVVATSAAPCPAHPRPRRG